jgi:predicted transcriptional regulator of viral defense system
VDINRLHRSSIIAVPQKEQAMAWLVTHGPLVANPPLPMAALRSLVTGERILRLRRDLYLAPDRSGRLPSLPETLNLVAPDGYISGHGALMLHGLDDQDISHWYSVTANRRPDVRYGLLRAHFVMSPNQVAVSATTSLAVGGHRVKVATAAQALVDEVLLMPWGLDHVETARVLRTAIEARAVTEIELVRQLGRRPSVAAARRLGLLLELVTSHPNADLLAMARSNRGVTRLAGDAVFDETWRLYLPQSRAEIAKASR